MQSKGRQVIHWSEQVKLQRCSSDVLEHAPNFTSLLHPLTKAAFSCCKGSCCLKERRKHDKRKVSFECRQAVLERKRLVGHRVTDTLHQDTFSNVQHCITLVDGNVHEFLVLVAIAKSATKPCNDPVISAYCSL